MDWLQVGPRIRQNYIYSLLIYSTHMWYIYWGSWLEEDECGFKIERRNIYNLHYTNNTTLPAKNTNHLQAFVMKVKKHSENMISSVAKTRLITGSAIRHGIDNKVGKMVDSTAIYLSIVKDPTVNKCAAEHIWYCSNESPGKRDLDTMRCLYLQRSL